MCKCFQFQLCFMQRLRMDADTYTSKPKVQTLILLQDPQEMITNKGMQFNFFLKNPLKLVLDCR